MTESDRIPGRELRVGDEITGLSHRQIYRVHALEPYQAPAHLPEDHPLRTPGLRIARHSGPVGAITIWRDDLVEIVRRPEAARGESR